MGKPPPVALAWPTEADAKSTTLDQKPIFTMKPIGEYPSPAEYKSAGLKPPPKNARNLTKSVPGTGEDDEGFMTDTPTTPTAEEGIPSGVACFDKRGDRYIGDVDLAALDVSIKKIAKRRLVPSRMNGVNGVKGNTTSHLDEQPNDDVNEDVNTKATAYKTNLATPVSETIDVHLRPSSTAPASLSPAETPLQTPADEDPTSSILAISDYEASLQSPPATAVTDADMASWPNKPTAPHLLKLLDDIPQPVSEVYDVPELKKVLEAAVSYSRDLGDDKAALSLVYFWSGVKKDEFKLALIHNMGRQATDHQLALALNTFLRHSMTEACQWYQNYGARLGVTLQTPVVTSPAATLQAPVVTSPDATRPDATRSGICEFDDSLTFSSTASLTAQINKPSFFKVSDIYRDTSGPKLEELFVSGKTNTAPYKRPKKPVRVNENSFKRRYEWDSDPTMGDKLRKKRARFAKETNVDEVPVQPSFVRPELPKPVTQADKPVEAPVGDAPGTSMSPRSKRAEERQKKQVLDKAPPTAAKKRKRASETPSLSARAQPQPIARTRPQLPIHPGDVDAWYKGWEIRQLPDTLKNDGENIDNCSLCGGGGKLLCCDTCENAFHFKCVKFTNKELTDDEWFCPDCDVRHEFTFAIQEGRKLEKEVDFSPPSVIKNFFEGVGEDTHYDPSDPDEMTTSYQPIPHIPRLTKRPRRKMQTPFYDDPNLNKVFENGQVIHATTVPADSTWIVLILPWLPPNPMEPYGWMCPNHVTPEDMIAKKTINGAVQERRVRRPRNLILMDAEPDTNYDRDSTFDDDWRAERLRLPPGDIIMEFVSAVKEEREIHQDNLVTRLSRSLASVAAIAIKDLATRNGAPIDQDWYNYVKSLCHSEARRVQAGDRADEDVSAADSLLDLAHHSRQERSDPQLGEQFVTHYAFPESPHAEGPVEGAKPGDEEELGEEAKPAEEPETSFTPQPICPPNEDLVKDIDFTLD
ncbi:hypothetical protein N7454_002033 [Penicillium verhagenii]|nr:hypothetical protein N7454_002033 [Penicillium verhagenii]